MRRGAVFLFALFLPAVASAVALTPRYQHTATLLPNRNVLVCGGRTGAGEATVTSSCQLSSEDGGGTYTNVAGMGTARSSHTAVLLPNGRVLVAGGWTGAAATNLGEVYDPDGNTWTAVGGTLQSARINHTATLLKNGRVLICGGQASAAGASLATCDFYDYTTNSFSAAASMQAARSRHTAVLLRDGKVWVAGGFDNTDNPPYLVTTEVYNPASNFFSAARSMITARADHSATMMGDGRILVAGGLNNRNIIENQGYLDTTEIYDPVSDSVAPGARMPIRLSRHSANVVPSGEVVIYGGLGNMTTTFQSPYSEQVQPGTIIGGTFNPARGLTYMDINAASTDLTVSYNGRLDVNTAGVIQEGLISFSTPSILLGGQASVFFNPTAAGGMSFRLDGTEVSCSDTSENAQCGNFNRAWATSNGSIQNVSGFYHLAPIATVDIEPGSVTSVSLNTTGGTLCSTNTPVNISGGSIVVNTYIRGLPLITEGATVSSGVVSISAAEIIQPSSWTATITSARINVPGGTPIVDAGNGTAQAGPFSATLDIFIGQVAHTAVSTPCYASPLTSPDSGVSATVQAQGSMLLSPSRLSITGASNLEDPVVATYTVRTMHFTEYLKYRPFDSAGQSNVWTLSHWAGSLDGETRQSFDHASVITPQGFIKVTGGRACDTATRDATCSTLTPSPFVQHGYVEIPEAFQSGATNMASRRANHTATLMPDGKILVAGGTNGPNVLNSTLLFDTSNGSFEEVGKLHSARDLHTATLLPNGRVLAAGGFATNAVSSGATNTAEIYYPDVKLWLPTTPMISSHSNHATVLLPDGNVLVIGGYANGVYLNSVEIFYSTAGHWRATTPLPGGQQRAQHTATLLPDGRVLVVGGLNAGGVINNSYILDTANYTWAAGPSLLYNTHSHSATLLQDGRVLIAGGNDEFGELNNATIFDPGTNTFTATGVLAFPRFSHNAVALPNGRVMLVGGFNSGGAAMGVSEFFMPGFGEWVQAGAVQSARGYGTVTLNRNGTLYLIGGYTGSQFLTSWESVAAYNVDDQYSPPGTGSSRRPAISAADRTVVDRDQNVNFTGTSFMGNSEASGGNSGSMGSSHFHPRLILERVEGSNGTGAQGNSGFVVDLSSKVFATPWSVVDTSATVRTPSTAAAMPYGWYQARVGSNGQYSVGHMIQVGPALPTEAVTSIVGVALDTSTLMWRWTAAGGSFDGYAVYSGTTNVLITTRPVTTDNACTPHPCFLQRGLTPNASSTIKIAAFNRMGDGPLLQSATSFPLAMPVTLSLASATADSVSLTWTTEGNREGTQYEVTYSSDEFVNHFTTQVPFGFNLQTTFYSVAPLAENTTFSFRIRARNGNGIETAFSNVVSTRTRSPVVNLAGVALDTTRVQWNWADPGGVSFYKVYNATSGAIISTPGTNLFIDTNLSTNTARVVRVSAVTGAGEGPLSPGVTVYTHAAVPLLGDPPIITVTTGSFVVNWGNPGNPPNTRYQVAVTSVTFLVGVTTRATTAATFAFGGLDFPGEIWQVQVRGLNEDSVLTEPLVVGSTPTLPLTPLNLTVTNAALSAITVTWDKGLNTSSVTYQVTYTTDNFTTHIATAVPYSAGFTGSAATVTGLLTSTTYSIRVIARNTAGRETVFSNIVTTRTSSGGAEIGSLAADVAPGQNTIISGSLGTVPPRSVLINVPADTFPSSVRITVSSHALTNSLCAAPNVSTTPVAVQLRVSPALQPTKKIFLTVGYEDTEVGSLDKSKLSLLRREDGFGKCVPMQTTVNSADRTVTAELNHLSIFQLGAISPASTSDSMRMFPNPWYASRVGHVTFHQMPADAVLKVHTVRGELVHEFRPNASGIATWNGINRGGRKVASGVYFVSVESGGDRKIIKLVVLR